MIQERFDIYVKRLREHVLKATDIKQLTRLKEDLTNKGKIDVFFITFAGPEFYFFSDERIYFLIRDCFLSNIDSFIETLKKEKKDIPDNFIHFG